MDTVHEEPAFIQKNVYSIPMEIPVIPQLHDSKMVTCEMTDEYYEVFLLPATS